MKKIWRNVGKGLIGLGAVSFLSKLLYDKIGHRNQKHPSDNLKENDCDQKDVKNELLYYESGKGRASNITTVVDNLLKNMDIKGRNVLLKPNMVTYSKDACSSTETMQIVVNLLKEHGACDIVICDEPAAHIINKPDFYRFDIYCGLGYNSIDGANVLDPEFLKETNYTAKRINPLTAKEENIQISVRDISEYLLVNLSQPKHHGQFNYSGVCKNLMGLVLGEYRKEFHHTFSDRSKPEVLSQAKIYGGKLSDRKDFFINFLKQYAQSYKGRQEDASELDLIQRLIDKMDYNIPEEKYINAAFTAQTHLEQIINSGAITSLVGHFKKTNPDSIHILDGSYLLSRHEHYGTPVETNFAIAGENPLVIDLAGIYKLGINVDSVRYIRELGERATENELSRVKELIEIIGEGGRLESPNLIQKKFVNVGGKGYAAINLDKSEGYKNSDPSRNNNTTDFSDTNYLEDEDITDFFKNDVITDGSFKEIKDREQTAEPKKESWVDKIPSEYKEPDLALHTIAFLYNPFMYVSEKICENPYLGGAIALSGVVGSIPSILGMGDYQASEKMHKIAAGGALAASLASFGAGALMAENKAAYFLTGIINAGSTIYNGVKGNLISQISGKVKELYNGIKGNLISQISDKIKEYTGK